MNCGFDQRTWSFSFSQVWLVQCCDFTSLSATTLCCLQTASSLTWLAVLTAVLIIILVFLESPYPVAVSSFMDVLPTILTKVKYFLELLATSINPPLWNRKWHSNWCLSLWHSKWYNKFTIILGNCIMSPSFVFYSRFFGGFNSNAVAPSWCTNFYIF